MNKKESLEIRKLFSKDSNVIGNIVSCLVDEEKEIRSIQKNLFYTLPEEDRFKYEEIFRKSLSGDIGKNLLNIDFNLESEKDGGAQNFLYDLRQSSLKDDELIEYFFNKIISSYEYKEKYYIILIDISYDVPKKTTDNLFMQDGSDEVYHAILCTICPVKLSKAALAYNSDKNLIENRTRDLVVEAPMQAFLFPSFTDRTSDIHSVLYYSKKANDIMPNFILEMFEAQAPLNVDEQKDSLLFNINSTVKEQMNFNVMKEIYEEINELYKENSENEEALVLEKPMLTSILKEVGIEKDKIQAFEEIEEDNLIFAKNIIGNKKLDIKKAGISIKVDIESTHLVETKIIDGKKCIVITVDDDVELNGVKVNTI